MRTHSLHPLATAGEGLLAAEVKDQAEQRRLAPLERRRVRLWFKLGIQLHRGHKSFSPFSHWPPPAPASPQSRRCGAPSGEKQAVIQRNTAHLPGWMQTEKRSRKGWGRRSAAGAAHTQPVSNFNVVKEARGKGVW